ncbi:hypothetical protein BDF21DRAFT_361512 [Thamnidium elegans]|nr:hypothetical protein BDF21DRAFT_361512 [Thamnidium elegans]
MSENNSTEVDNSKGVKDIGSSKGRKYEMHDGTTRGLFFIRDCKKAYPFVLRLPELM